MTIAENSINVDIQEQDVVVFLRDNPQFFHKYPDVLAQMQLHSQDITPFHERQLQVLRQREASAKEKLDYLMQSLTANQRLEDDIQAFALALLANPPVTDLSQRKQLLCEFVKRHFRVEFAPISMKQETAQNDAQLSVFERISHQRSVCDDRLPSAVLQELFADDAAAIGSCAIVPLMSKQAVQGALALGVADAQRFQPSMGVVYLDRIGALASAYLFA